MADRLFGGYGPQILPPQPSSRIVPAPDGKMPFDIQGSLDRIRAAQAQAQAQQAQAQADKDALETGHMNMNRESNTFRDTDGIGKSYETAKNISLHLGPQLTEDDYRAPGAPTQKEQAQQLAEASKQMFMERERKAAEQGASMPDDWDSLQKGFDEQIGADIGRMTPKPRAEPKPVSLLDFTDEYIEERTQDAHESARDLAKKDAESFENGMLLDEASPQDAPLPGEETLFPSIARWNDYRAMSGNRGLSSLQRRYMEEVPEGTRGMMTFEKWLMSHGVTADTEYNEARAKLNLLADNRLVRDAKSGDMVAQPSNKQHYDLKKKRFLDEAARRFAVELGLPKEQGGITMAEIEAAYDAGVKTGAVDSYGDPMNDPHLAGVRGANSTILDGAKRNRTAQIEVNLKRRRDQMGRASTWGMPLAQVQFYDSLQNAQTPQEAANVLILAHSQDPSMGYDKAAALLMKGQLDQASLQQWAAGQGNSVKGVNKLGSDLQGIYNAPITAATLPQLQAISATLPGQENASPAEKKKTYLEIQRPLARKVAAKKEEPTADEFALLQSATEGMSPEEFYKYLDLDPKDPQSEAIYKAVFGKAPPRGFFPTLSSIGEFFGSGFPSPAAWAGQPEPPAE